MYSPLDVGDAFNNLPNGHIMRGVHVSTEGVKVLEGAMGTSYFARDTFDSALSKYEAYYGVRLTRGLATHRHSLSHSPSYLSTLQQPRQTLCPYGPPRSWKGRRLR
jgi:hypothetical protein